MADQFRLLNVRVERLTHEEYTKWFRAVSRLLFAARDRYADSPPVWVGELLAKAHAEHRRRGTQLVLFDPDVLD